MEAKTLKKKNSINKSKLKKTMKNILCRPDPMFWPLLSTEHSNEIESILDTFKVDIPVFRKPLWSEIKDIPKEDRPKPPKLKKVDGLLFGITTCVRSISNGSCEGVIIDAEVNPKMLVQHVVEACTNNKVPLLCLNGLKRICTRNFGFSSCCLGVSKGFENLSPLVRAIISISMFYSAPEKQNIQEPTIIECDNKDKDEIEEFEEKVIEFTYLLRPSDKTRAFVPPTISVSHDNNLEFKGQQFINIQNNSSKKPKLPLLKNMVVKRVTNNVNRKKKK